MAETNAWRVEHGRHHERTDERHARTPNLTMSIIIAGIAAAGLLANLFLARGGP